MIKTLFDCFSNAFSWSALSGVWHSLAPVYICWAIAEFFFPAQKNQQLKWIARNIVIVLLYATLGTSIKTFLNITLWSHFQIEPLINLDNYIPVVIAPIISVFIFDFFYYFFHRLQHKNRFLWRLHAIHHADPCMNVTTSERVHWLEDVLRAPLILVPMGLLFKLTVVDVFIVSSLTSQWGYFTHSNLRLPLGPLNLLIVGPQYHRIHHSIEKEHYDKNFAAFFPFWDILFGTFYKPNNWAKTGLNKDDGAFGIRKIFFGYPG